MLQQKGEIQILPELLHHFLSLNVACGISQAVAWKEVRGKLHHASQGRPLPFSSVILLIELLLFFQLA